MKYKGQKGQDRWVIKDIFNLKKNGYFVDLAASSGIYGNNTYIMENNLNWNGICIEPNPTYFERLKKNRKCHLANYVVDKKNNQEVKFRVDNGQLGGIVDKDTDNNYKYRSKELKNANILKLKTKTLQYILEHYKAPKVIDYLSLDIEGAEERALINFPFNKYKFLTITIERPTKKLEKLLFDNGYVFVMKSKKVNYDSFYVHKSIPNFKKIKKEKYEPTPKKTW